MSEEQWRRHELPGGAALAYREVGSGLPLLLLHGVLASSCFFDRNLAPLAERHRVIAVDLRGHGESPTVEGGYTVPQLARDVRHFILEKDLRDVVAVGWSMGNFVIWDYLAQFAPDPRLSAQICISQSASDLTTNDWSMGFTDAGGLRDLLRNTQEDYRAVASYLATIMTKYLPAEDEQQWMVEQQLKLGANAATCILADQTQRDYRTQIESLALPLLAVWGRDEKCLPVAAGTWLANTAVDVELHVFDESGHMPMWEEPERFNQLVLEWIDRRLGPPN